mgnify:CR=1 FL=1
MGNQFIMPGKIVYGENALNDAKELIADFGKKALIVTDRFMVRSGNVRPVEDILSELGIEFSVFDGVNSEPTDVIIDMGIKQYRDENCDFLIALGGGSPIDAMKLSALLPQTAVKLTITTERPSPFRPRRLLLYPQQAALVQRQHSSPL